MYTLVQLENQNIPTIIYRTLNVIVAFYKDNGNKFGAIRRLRKACTRSLVAIRLTRDECPSRKIGDTTGRHPWPCDDGAPCMTAFVVSTRQRNREETKPRTRLNRGICEKKGAEVIEQQTEIINSQHGGVTSSRGFVEPTVRCMTVFRGRKEQRKRRARGKGMGDKETFIARSKKKFAKIT